MPLGIFAFAIIPVIGLMGTGLKVSKESIDASTAANIYRLAEAMLSTNASVTSTNMYFSKNSEAAPGFAPRLSAAEARSIKAD